MFTHYNKEKNRLYLPKALSPVDYYETAQEVKSFLATRVPKTLRIDCDFKTGSLRVHLKVNSFLSAYKWENKKLFKDNDIRANIVFHLTAKGSYLNVSKIVSMANDIDKKLEPLIKKGNEKQAWLDKLASTVYTLRNSLDIREKDTITCRDRLDAPFVLTLGLVSEEEVRTVYRLIREVCGI